MSNTAERESYHIIGETCPAVDQAISDMETIIKKQTSALREALVDALQRAIDAEDKVEEANNNIEQLSRMCGDYESQIEDLERDKYDLEKDCDEMRYKLSIVESFI